MVVCFQVVARTMVAVTEVVVKAVTEVGAMEVVVAAMAEVDTTPMVRAEVTAREVVEGDMAKVIDNFKLHYYQNHLIT